MKRILSFLFGFCLILFWLLFSVKIFVFSSGFYQNLYDRINLSETTGISNEDLMSAITTMTDYVQGKRDDMDVIVTWKGETGQAFNEKEQSHMVDVRNLWLNARTVMYVSAAIAVLCAVILFWKAGWDAPAMMARGFFEALVCFAVVIVFFGFWAIVDFTGFWTEFHHVFFTNDLWLLDPNTDFMIVICPEQMFSSLILRIVLCFAGGLAVLSALFVYALKKARIGVV